MRNRETRQQLLTILGAMPELSTSGGRSLLLQYLPRSLVNQIPRDNAPAIDLANIVGGCDAWESLPGQDHPLGLLLSTAREYAKGPQRIQLVELIATLPPGFVPETPRPLCPYPGMVPFTDDYARFFYGRSVEVGQILQRLRHQHFLLVIGPSGSGKSSLIFAGLLPALERSSYGPPGFWRVLTMRPGAHPTDTLAQLLGGDLDDPAQAVAAFLISSPAQPTPKVGGLLLVVDQLEEVFAQANKGEQARFIACLKALRTLDSCAVVTVARADFYPDLLDSDLWKPPPGEGERLEVRRLAGDTLRQAIVQPAADVGVVLEGALVERLLADAADEPGSLPLLQETLVLLWNRMDGRTLTLRAYEELGSEGRSGLAVAVANKADATYATLTPAQQAIARRIFLRLIQFGEGRPDTRRQLPVAALQDAGDDPAVFAATLATLTENRLLTLSGENRPATARMVDIAHEALITGWPTLQTWIGERRAAEQTRRRLEEQAAEWVRLGRGAGGLLDAAELPEAERWLASADAVELGVSADLRALVAASRRAARADRQRLVVTLAVMFLLLVMAVIGAGLARLQTQAAQTQSRVARAQALAANAVAQLDRDPELSILLAMQAISVTRVLGEPIVPQAEDALHYSLWRSPIRATLHSKGQIYSAAFSPDGRSIVTADSDGTATLWDVASGQQRVILRGHTGAVNSAAFSPDGRSIVTASGDKTVKVWDAVSGQERTTLSGYTEEVDRAAFSSDGHSIITFSADGMLKVWGIATGEAHTTMYREFGVRLSPDGLTVVTTSGDGTATVWDALSNAKRATLHGHNGTVLGAMYSPDGRSIVTASSDGTAKVWDATSGQERATLRGHTNNLTSAAFSPDGLSIVTASIDGTAKVWDATNGAERTTLHGHNSSVESAVFSPDGRSIVTASLDGTAKLWDATGGEERATLRGHTEVVISAMYSPDGRSIVTTSGDGTAKLWDAVSGQERATLRGHTDRVDSAAYSPDGRSIVTASADGTARVWDAVSGAERAILRDHIYWVHSAVFSPDGRSIVTANSDGTAIIWDVTSGQQRVILRGHTDEVVSAAYSPDGRSIVTASADGTARLWDAVSGQEWTILHGYVGMGNRIPLVVIVAGGAAIKAAFSPDGQTIVAAGDNNTAKVWDASSGEVRVTLRGHADGVYDAEFSSDGRSIVTASFDGTAKVWDAVSGQERATLRGHTARVVSATFSPDGRTIVTASDDGTAKVWDAASGQERATLRGHTRKELLIAAFSPDGRSIVTASFDGTARQYVVSIPDLLALAQSRVTRALTPEERAAYLGEPLPTPTLAPPVTPTTPPRGSPTPGP